MKMIGAIPAIPVNSISTAVHFYQKKMGFTCDYHDHSFAKLLRDEVEIHLWAANDHTWKQRDPVTSPILSGAESFLAGTAGCRIEVSGIDDLYIEYKMQDVLYGPETTIETTAWETREFPALDLNRNLLTFFERIKTEKHLLEEPDHF